MLPGGTEDVNPVEEGRLHSSNVTHVHHIAQIDVE
jgi:hypothetical protein